MAHHSDPTFEMDVMESSLLSSSRPFLSSKHSPSSPSSPSFNILRYRSCISTTNQNLIDFMADQEPRLVHSGFVSDCPRDKSVHAKQKREELEKEVASLQKVLKDEEKVREVLDRALLSNGAKSTLNIPSFLPKKTKELLAELVMVEEEIARLENERSKIQQDSAGLQQIQVQECLEFDPHNKRTNLNTLFEEPMISTKTPKNKGMNEKLGLENAPMFFINQAIKGNYTLNGFTSKGNNETSTETVKKRESHRVVSLEERLPKKSGVIHKPSSPKPPKHSSLRHSDANTEMLLTANSSQKNSKNLQPNKLSEKLVKCLTCIFLRLMRTSRASSEQERLGTSSRSPSSLLRTRSNQVESGLNSTPRLTSLKETRQQDPYGIFEIEESLTRDIGHYKNLIKCTSSSLDFNNTSSCLKLMGKLRELMNNLCKVDLRLLTHHQKLAFWINIYNACIMHGILQLGLPSNPDKIIALKKKVVINVGGNKLNALAIEHFILKQPSKGKEDYWNGIKDEGEDFMRNIYGLEHPEPNITFALCCGSRSSPSVRIYSADGVSAELEKSKLEYLQASIVVTASKRIMIPYLLESNMHEFATDLGSLVEWICNQLPTSGSLKKSMAECLRCLRKSGEISNIVDIIPYDSEFQYLLPLT